MTVPSKSNVPSLWRHFSARLFFLFPLIWYTKRCLQIIIKNVLWLSFCDMTVHVPSKSNVPSMWPWPLTNECQFCWWIDYDPISVLYKYKIDISTNSRWIKYRNMGVWFFFGQILTYFVTSFLCSLKCLLFHRIEYPKKCLWKKL